MILYPIRSILDESQRDSEALKWITNEAATPDIVNSQSELRVGDFRLKKNQTESEQGDNETAVSARFNFHTETVVRNVLKVLRGMTCIEKPILLEGTPGVGKSSLVTALAAFTGNQLIRINLSDQTEISDLFGSDLPVGRGDSAGEDVQGGDDMAKFAWQDGPFLSALKAGKWILLDELNLATQSVLEGLNACLDHRGEVYIPELNRTFIISSSQVWPLTQFYFVGYLQSWSGVKTFVYLQTPNQSF